MFLKASLLSMFVWLLAASPALAHEPCGCRSYPTPTYQSFPSACLASQSPFRLTRLRTIQISSASSLPQESPSTAHYGQIRRPIDHASCRVYQEIEK